MRAWPILVVVAVLAAGCGTPASRPVVTAEVLRTGPDYQEALKRAQALTEGPLLKYVQNKPLNGDDISALERAEPIVRGMIAFRPDGFGPHFLLGQILRATGRMDEAATAFEKAVRLAPPEGGKDVDMLTANALSELASIYFGRRQMEKAEDAIRAALILAPDSAVFLCMLARIQIDNGQAKPARETLERALRLDKENKEAKELMELLSRASQPGGGSSSSPSSSGGQAK